jgi:CheY-like chemotaxis protein
MPDHTDKILPVILYVEDSEEAFVIVEYFLKKKYSVIGAANVEKAITQLFSNEVALILMDINLRQPQDGIHLTINLKMDERFKNIPIVALTAYSMEYKLDTIYKEVGFENVIQKPVEKQELIDKITKCIEKNKITGNVN